MFDTIKLIAEKRELQARINTLEIENELLRDRRLDELLKELNKENKCEDLEKQLERANLKIQALKEVIKELSNAKNKR